MLLFFVYPTREANVHVQNLVGFIGSAAEIDLIFDDAAVTMVQSVNGKLVLTDGDVKQKKLKN